MNKKKLIVFGAGRMGLSHSAMAGLIDKDLETFIVEPNFKTRLILNFILKGKIIFKKKLDNISLDKFTHAIIATPPSIHKLNLNTLIKNGFKGRILIEKPISIERSEFKNINNLMSGYVLRHSYFVRKLKEEIKGKEIKKISIHLETNQNFDLKSNWRSDEQKFPGYSLLSEFGSHCINLLINFYKIEKLFIREHNANFINISDKEKIFSIILKGNSNKVRKSVYNVNISSDKFDYFTDLYVFSKKKKEEGLEYKSSLASLGINSKSYLRGIDFSSQMELFLSKKPLQRKDFNDSLKTDEILSDILNNF